MTRISTSKKFQMNWNEFELFDPRHLFRVSVRFLFLIYNEACAIGNGNLCN